MRGDPVLSKYLLWVIVANYEKAVVEYEARQKYLTDLPGANWNSSAGP